MRGLACAVLRRPRRRAPRMRASRNRAAGSSRARRREGRSVLAARCRAAVPGVPRAREVIEVDLGGALAPKPAARSKHRTAELGGRAKHVGPAESLGVWALAQAIRNLAKGRARDRRGAVDVVDKTGHVVKYEGEVRIEPAFYGRRPCAEGWRFDVYLIHYWDGERMPAV